MCLSAGSQSIVVKTMGLKMQIPAADREHYLTKILHNTQDSHVHTKELIQMLSPLIAEEKSAAGKETVSSFIEQARNEVSTSKSSPG